MLKQKIKYVGNDDLKNYKLDELKFLVFHYIIPRPFFPPVKKTSKVYCLPKDQVVGKLGSKYSMYNLLVCGFGLPIAPNTMLVANRLNEEGTDVTADIVDKIELTDVAKGFYERPLYDAPFIKLDKPIVKEFESRLRTLKSELNIDSNLLIGYIRAFHKHYFYIGLSDTENEQAILDILQEGFNDSTIISISNINYDDELVDKLKAEGTVIGLSEN